MKQQDKELLLKDLCARLPYGVKVTTTSNGWNGIYTITGYNNDRIYLDCPIYDEGDDEWLVESIKPYLRPMSSMTEEEKKELDVIMVFNDGTLTCITGTPQAYDFLNSNHFDYHGLIPLGLAIEVTEENNPYKE